MKAIRPVLSAALLTAFSVAPAATPDFHNRAYDFPIYKNHPPGPQTTGQHAPATTPALSPDDALKKFTLLDGFEIRLFAAEPMVVNPITMTWDERGRLWVLEAYEYPLGAKDGEKGRDRIKILEDTDADGVADKVTVFADGMSLATGMVFGNGGVYVGQAPDLLFLKDTDGDDKADVRQVLLTGFGMEDRHELLNGFAWGPDGYLYMTHGVFTFSKVHEPGAPEGSGVSMNAAVGRFDPQSKRFEVFADGTSNPWGVDFDERGNAFVSACVIDHFFHLAPGGLYSRQAGQPAFPYAYELLPSIVDHAHKMAAYCGVNIYQGNQYPAEYHGKALMGNIHDNAIHADQLSDVGSSFKASKWKDFVRGNDGWFMPTSIKTGPDGAVWISDWYDKYPCYQNARADPEGVDRVYGRIYRVVYTGADKGKPVPSRPSVDMNLGKLDNNQLVELLADDNIWQRRQAQRLLSERLRGQNSGAPVKLVQMFTSGPNVNARLAALWTLHGTGALTEDMLDQAANDKEAAIRTWAARLTGERQTMSDQVAQRMSKLTEDSDAEVRLAAATALRQYMSGSLTVNTPPTNVDVNPGPYLANLIEHSYQQPDRTLDFMIWMAAEPAVVKNIGPTLGWFAGDGAQYMPLSGQLAAKTMRRICDLGDRANVDLAMQFLDRAADEHPALASAALDGLLEGEKGRVLLPQSDSGPVLAKLVKSENAALRERAQQLGSLWGDASALQASFDTAVDQSAAVGSRLTAIASVRSQKSNAARDTMFKVLDQQPDSRLVVAAIHALGEIGGNESANYLIDHWNNLKPAERREAAGVLVTRGGWNSSLLSALEQKRISTSDIPATAIRAMVKSKDDYGMLAKRAEKVFGRVRDADKDKLKLIAAKREMVLQGTPDIEHGHEVAKTTCFVCHKLHGEGADIGPDLTGVGRSSLDALLANVIDPNQIIGKGYENVVVETKDGRTLSGRLVEETDSRIKLINIGPTEFVIGKNEIQSRTVSDMSLMPEGLEQMPDKDFRDLIWFILAPPQEGPLTPQKRADLIGAISPTASNQSTNDGESVALWNPEWRVIAPDFEGTPKKYPEYAGHRNVLETHPFSDDKPSALERVYEVPVGGAKLTIEAAAHERGDWELRVFANGEMLKREVISRKDGVWHTVTADLSKFAGERIALRVENMAGGENDWSFEFAYWGKLQLTAGAALQAKR
ncbi:c-type cytochrome [bacterium]|nr:c-type cytochrome [bacterium]